jgi:hypothetical protein
MCHDIFLCPGGVQRARTGTLNSLQSSTLFPSRFRLSRSASRSRLPTTGATGQPLCRNRFIFNCGELAMCVELCSPLPSPHYLPPPPHPHPPLMQRPQRPQQRNLAPRPPPRRVWCALSTWNVVKVYIHLATALHSQPIALLPLMSISSVTSQERRINSMNSSKLTITWSLFATDVACLTE